MGDEGRPTKRTSEAAEAIALALTQGKTRKLAANYGGMSYQTMREWEKSDPEFSDLLQNAEATYRQTLLDRIESAATQGAMVQRRDGTIIHEPGQWQAAAWILERRWPQEFARKQAVELTGKDGGPVEHRDVASLSDHEQDLLAAAIRDHLRGQGEPAADLARDRER